MALSLSSAALLLAASAAGAAAQALPPVCLLYIDGISNQFTFGNLLSNGTVNPLVAMPTWGEVGNGIDAGEDNTTFYTQPEVAGRRRRGKYFISDILAQHSQSSGATQLRGSQRQLADSAPVATISITSPSTASVTYSTLGPIPGHASQGDAIADMSLDSTRSQMVGTVECTSGSLCFIIADLSPSNGTVDKVWLDITSQWTSWSWMKYGVSTYDDVNQVYYMTVGINNASGVAIETILGFPLQGGAPIPLPLQPGYDVLSLSWSHSLAAPIILTTDRIRGTLTYLSWNAASSAWIPFFSYADNSVTSNELGQTTITQDGSIIISTLEPASGASGWDFSVSFVSVSSRKEINRILIADGMDLLADLEICNVNV